MLNKVQLFNYKGKPVRVAWFDEVQDWSYNLADICKILKLGNPSQVAERLAPDGIRISDTIDALGRQQPMLWVNMPNYLRAIMRAHPNKSPEAKAFQDWVCEEVLPTILKTGSYSMNSVNFDNLIELDPCTIKDNKKLLRRIVMLYEDAMLGMHNEYILYKKLEEKYHPEQARPRGRRDVSGISVYATDETMKHLVFKIEEEEIVVQTTFVFENEESA